MGAASRQLHKRVIRAPRATNANIMIICKTKSTHASLHFGHEDAGSNFACSASDISRASQHGSPSLIDKASARLTHRPHGMTMRCALSPMSIVAVGSVADADVTKLLRGTARRPSSGRTSAIRGNDSDQASARGGHPSVAGSSFSAMPMSIPETKA